LKHRVRIEVGRPRPNRCQKRLQQPMNILGRTPLYVPPRKVCVATRPPRWSWLAPQGVLGGSSGGHTRDSPGQHVHSVVGGDAGTNHHFRVIIHRVLDTLWGYTKFELTCGGHLRLRCSMEGCGRGGGGGAAADHQLHHDSLWRW